MGDTVQRGERIGLIKFGSRTDVLLEPKAEVRVKVGDRVKGGLSILAFLNAQPQDLATAGAAQAKEGSR
jgi:phosphatidylserine decarboxylase